ncbi:hypothetical protein CPB84DRAFT_1777365 [Gymnopilus junonius]|uniref:Uncharacterized protein n=1 Tax=Gymnopilus junonius TaxID=109634 RepID=A0A9P5NLN0_GYMJU|nr:hypothetical protein CPB84DRAFT_1777365 [Gymnopilus junonius]
MTEAATDLIAIINDMHSYGLEYSRGLDGHNVVTAIMHEYDLDLQGALYWLSGYATSTVSKFLSDRHTFLHGVQARCVRGYDQWSYETKRYYGQKGSEPRDEAYLTRDQLQITVA